MKKHYEGVAGYAPSELKRRLVGGIDATQKGNESQFGGDISRYSVTLEKVNRYADLIGASLGSDH